MNQIERYQRVHAGRTENVEAQGKALMMIITIISVELRSIQFWTMACNGGMYLKMYLFSHLLILTRLLRTH